MKQTILFLTLILLAAASLRAQNKFLRDPGGATPAPIFSNEDFLKLIGSNFSKIVTGQSTVAPGRFAGLDIADAKATFAPSFALKNRNVITGRFEGAVTEGVSSLFNNSKLNTSLSLNISYHLLLKKKREEIEFSTEEYSAAAIAVIKLEMEAAEKSFKIITENQINDTTASQAYAEIVKLKDYTFEKLSIDELNSRLASVRKYRSTIATAIRNTSIKERGNFEILDNFYTNKIIRQERVNDVKIQAFNLNWFTFSAKVANDDFRLLRVTNTETQVEKSNYVSPGASVQFSHYRYNETRNSLYYALAVGYLRKSNYLDLTKTTVVEDTDLPTQGNTSLRSTDTYIAYAGNYEKDITELKVNADIYYFLSKFERIALHAYESSRFTENIKPYHNLGVGLVVPFKDQDNEKSIINAEVYYTIKDIFNTGSSQNDIFSRNELGLRFTFPFNF